jgi:hypothetical protein
VALDTGRQRTRTGNEGDIRVEQLAAWCFLGAQMVSGLACVRFLQFRPKKKGGDNSVIQRSLFSELSQVRRPGNDGQAFILPSSFHLRVENPRGRNGARYGRSACPLPSWVTQSSALTTTSPTPTRARRPWRRESALGRRQGFLSRQCASVDKKGDQDPGSRGPLGPSDGMLPTPPSPPVSTGARRAVNQGQSVQSMESC